MLALLNKLEKAKAIAEKIKALLEPACDRIEIVGSIRRRKPEVGDTELLCIPKYVDGVDQLDKELGALFIQRILAFRRNKLGRAVYGPKKKLLRHVESGIGVDIFSTTEECWAVAPGRGSEKSAHGGTGTCQPLLQAKSKGGDVNRK